MIAEQHVRKLLTLTVEAIIMERGGIVWSERSEALAADTAVLDSHLGVAMRGACAGVSTAAP